MNHDSELDNPLFKRLDAETFRADRLEIWLGVVCCIAAVLLVLVIIMWLGPLAIPQKGVC